MLKRKRNIQELQRNLIQELRQLAEQNQRITDERANQISQRVLKIFGENTELYPEELTKLWERIKPVDW